MNILPTQFTKKGWLHRQIDRQGDVAIFERSKKGIPTHFEVVRITRHNGYTIHGANIPPGENYPGDETWGKRGWTYSDSEKALAKFRTLVAMPTGLPSGGKAGR